MKVSKKVFRYVFLLSATIGVLCSSGCRSTKLKEPVYYRLEYSNAGSVPEGTSAKVFSVNLPDYLMRLGIAVEEEGSKIRYARYHRWSEPLQAGIERVLEQALAGKCSSAYSGSLVLNVDTFSANEKGVVVFAGTWSEMTKAKEEPAYHGFQIEVGLESDGYSALVLAHQQCIVELAEQVCATSSE